MQALWTTASLFSNFLLLTDYFVGCILMFIFYEGRFTFSETIQAGWKLRPDFHSCLCSISVIVLFQKTEQKKLAKKKVGNFLTFLVISFHCKFKEPIKYCVNITISFQARNFIKNRHQHRCFPVNIATFLKTAFL